MKVRFLSYKYNILYKSIFKWSQIRLEVDLSRHLKEKRNLIKATVSNGKYLLTVEQSVLIIHVVQLMPDRITWLSENTRRFFGDTSSVSHLVLPQSSPVRILIQQDLSLRYTMSHICAQMHTSPTSLLLCVIKNDSKIHGLKYYTYTHRKIL